MLCSKRNRSPVPWLASDHAAVVQSLPTVRSHYCLPTRFHTNKSVLSVENTAGIDGALVSDGVTRKLIVEVPKVTSL